MLTFHGAKSQLNVLIRVNHRTIQNKLQIIRKKRHRVSILVLPLLQDCKPQLNQHITESHPSSKQDLEGMQNRTYIKEVEDPCDQIGVEPA